MSMTSRPTTTSSKEGEWLRPAYADPTKDQLELYEAGAQAFSSDDWPAAIDYLKASLAIGEMNITYLTLGQGSAQVRAVQRDR